MRERIESDEQALAMYTSGNLAGCAARLSEISPVVRKPVSASDIQYYTSIMGVWGAINLAREKSDTPDQIKAICITFLDWVRTGRSVDIDLPVVQQMMGGLVQSGLLTQGQADQIDTLANTQPTYTTDQILEFMSNG